MIPFYQYLVLWNIWFFFQCSLLFTVSKFVLIPFSLFNNTNFKKILSGKILTYFFVKANTTHIIPPTTSAIARDPTMMYTTMKSERDKQWKWMRTPCTWIRGHSKSMSLKISKFLTLLPHVTLSHHSPWTPSPLLIPQKVKTLSCKWADP